MGTFFVLDLVTWVMCGWGYIMVLYVEKVPVTPNGHDAAKHTCLSVVIHLTQPIRLKCSE